MAEWLSGRPQIEKINEQGDTSEWLARRVLRNRRSLKFFQVIL